MSVGCFLQVRLHSQRLPRKALLPLKGGSVLEHTLRALRRVPADVHALLTDERSVEAFSAAARQAGFALLVGPEEDVLGRFAQAVREFRVERVIRATGDNPLVCPDQAVALMEIHRRNRLCLSHFVRTPLGTGVEIVEAEALLEAEAQSVDPFEREHITTYLYRHRDRFRVGEIAAPPHWCFPEGKVTLDTPSDYDRLGRIFADLYRGAGSAVTTEQVVRWLKAHPEEAASGPEGEPA
jgi:spore coat polysaccharide biosynthesis protein SpsF